MPAQQPCINRPAEPHKATSIHSQISTHPKSSYYPPLMILTTLMVELSSDLYLPSLPEMTTHFQTQDHLTVMTISLYLLGFSLLGCISGPLSDARGRRPIIMTCLGLFMVSSWFCLNAQTVYQLAIFRFFQGIFAGSACVVSTAIIKDIFEENACSKILSNMGMIIALSPAVAPILGAKIATHFGWQTNFKVIFFTALFVFIVTFLLLPESLQKSYRQNFSFKVIFKQYKVLLKRPQVVCYALISGFMCGSIWTWIAIAPFFFIDELGLSSEFYGYCASIGPGSYILGSFLNQRYVGFLGVHKMLKYGIIVTLIGALILNYAILIDYPSHQMPGPLFFGGLILFGMGLAPVFSNSTTLSISVEPNHRGAASAILCFFEMALSGIFSYMASLADNGTLAPATLLMGLSILISIGLYMWVRKYNKTDREGYPSESTKIKIGS